MAARDCRAKRASCAVEEKNGIVQVGMQGGRKRDEMRDGKEIKVEKMERM